VPRHEIDVENTERFIQARDHLLRANAVATPAGLAADLTAPAGALGEFRWPRFTEFNWARDYFDVIADGNSAPALRLIDDTGRDVSLCFQDLAGRSERVAGFFASLGVQAGDRMLVILPNVAALWETLLAAIRLGAVLIPATTLLQGEDLRDRLERGHVKIVVTEASLTGRFVGLGGAPLRIACRGR
jgi:acetyl-CoA synthetase